MMRSTSSSVRTHLFLRWAVDHEYARDVCRQAASLEEQGDDGDRVRRVKRGEHVQHPRADQRMQRSLQAFTLLRAGEGLTAQPRPIELAVLREARRSEGPDDLDVTRFAAPG